MFETDFKSKTEIFNTYDTQCRPLSSDNVLPNLKYITDGKLNNMSMSSESITSIINKLNPKKAHDYDNICIAMLKLCSLEVSVSLKIIYDQCMENGKFTDF